MSVSSSTLKSDIDKLLIATITGRTGNLPTDYYYTFNSSGYRIYHSRITNKRVLIDKLPPMIITDIPAKDLDLNKEQLLQFREGYKKEIKRLIGKMHEIDIKIDRMSDPKELNNMKKEEDELKQRDEIRKQEYQDELNDLFNRLFSRFGFKIPECYINSGRDILKELDIKTKKDLHKWLRNGGHPDKGGDEKLCQEVMGAAKRTGIF